MVLLRYRRPPEVNILKFYEEFKVSYHSFQTASLKLFLSNFKVVLLFEN